jgi:hypothetical protein
MNCEAVRAQLPLMLYGELSFDEEEGVECHLEGCAGCRAALERERFLAAALDQAATEPSPALLRACREGLAERLALEPAPGLQSSVPASRPGWWDRIVDWLTLPGLVLRPAGALALVAVGFLLARLAPGVLPELGSGLGIASLAGLNAARVRSVEPAADGTVRIVLDETRQRTVDGPWEDAAIRMLLLAAAKDPSDGVRAETVALLSTRAHSADVRNALIDAVRHDRNAGVRLRALDGLQAFLSEAEVRGALTDVLSSDANPAMRMRAIEMLLQGLTAESAPTPLVDERMLDVLQQVSRREEENPYLRQRCQRVLELVNASAELF